MIREYHAQRRQGGHNPLGIGVIPAGAIFYLQPDWWWRDRYRPELTERPSGTHKRTRAEHIIDGTGIWGWTPPAYADIVMNGAR
ncbi:MAG TPA: hypothetical protein VKI44_22870 [Acetobacteraceae bacterium]|nr:hypothetical protein [Acetobacteraceae bacterium]